MTGDEHALHMRFLSIQKAVSAARAECVLLGHYIDPELESYQDPTRMVLKNPYCLACGAKLD